MKSSLQFLQKEKFISIFLSVLFTFFSFMHVLAQWVVTITPINLNPPSCGGDDSDFQVQTSGIEAPYQVRLFKNINGSFVLQETSTLIAGTPTVVALTGGTYQVVVDKGGTCGGSVEVTLVEPPMTLKLASFSLPNCGVINGNFQVQTTGIVPPYTYKLFKQVDGSSTLVQEGTLNSSMPSFTGLSEGVYQLSVDKGGTCSGSITVYLYCEAIGKEGCSPGYWKNSLSAWEITNYAPTQTLEDVFDIPDGYGLDNLTLLEALQDS